MTFKISSGLRDHMLLTGSLKSGVDGGVIRVYNGTAPATADAALSGNTLLCVISNAGAGTGINLNTVAAGGVITKAPAETWSGEIVASGTASFYRFSGLADAGGSSTSEKRLQGDCATAGADLNFGSVTFVDNDSNTKTINSYSIALPTV